MQPSTPATSQPGLCKHTRAVFYIGDVLLKAVCSPIFLPVDFLFLAFGGCASMSAQGPLLFTPEHPCQVFLPVSWLKTVPIDVLRTVNIIPDLCHHNGYLRYLGR